MLRVRWEDFGVKNKELAEKVSDISVLAKRINVSINDYTSADTFDIEIDYKQFPFDPRAIRAVGVTIAMEDVKSLVDENGNPKKIVPRSEADENGNEPNIVFVGFADEESIDFDDTKRTVKLEGRDFTSLLVDRKYLGQPVNVSQPVDKVIQRLIDELKETAKLTLDVRVPGKLPTLAKFYHDNDETAGRKNSRRDESYWDLIQRIVNQAGLIAYIELDKLVVTTPRILYGTDKIKRFIYGRNVKTLNFKRKVGRRKNFNILVRSMILSKKQVLTAKIPMEATDQWSKETGIPNQEVKIPEVTQSSLPKEQQEPKPAPYMSFRLTNINSKDHLIEVGQNIYEELGRQQIEGSFETADMMTFQSGFEYVSQGNAIEGSRSEFDILKLRNGTPISIWIQNDDLLDSAKFANDESRELYMKARGLNSRAARLLSEAIGKADASFYTKAVTFSLDETSGFKAKVEFINFIQVENPNLAKGGD